METPIRSKQTPATEAMLYEVKEHICHRTDKGFEEARAARQELSDRTEKGFEEARAARAEARSERQLIRSEMKTQFHELKSEFHRLALIVEEQNARNKFVLDGYAQIYDLLKQKLKIIPE